MPVPEAGPEADPDLALLTEAARCAGQIALRYWRQSPNSWEKPDGSGPVTEADIAVNDMLHALLTRARPNYGWLSEETPDSSDRQHRARTFILDPIDGTRAFMAGEEHFAHSLAVAEAGQISAAAVYLPALDRIYTATRSGPARCNGQPIRCGSAALDGATVLASRPALAAEHWKSPPPVRRAFRASLAYRLCLVAEGAFDAMLTLRDTWEWDVAAGDLIARRAGATVTDRHGAALAFNNPGPKVQGVLVGNPALHQAVSRLLL